MPKTSAAQRSKRRAIKAARFARWVIEATILFVLASLLLGYAGIVTFSIFIAAASISAVVVIENLFVRPFMNRIRKNYRPGGIIDLNKHDDQG